ncbi:5'-nucleotidase [Enhygromyxa salina]|uniref:5'-nucleotidase n=1 Tax=Enhygromyxa salina TaxID=215803 RepID=A0A0C2D711_9BACT|nr:5'-nucleotidase C-terminal domain-containing protein [Enhygromyxa salina]KIG15817.1 5'-nucleotidase [Enhygromyxa salina]
MAANTITSPPRGPSLRVICVNDIYSLENLPRLKSLVQHHAETNPADRMVVTLAGDFVAPSILSSLDKGAGMIECLNEIPITHAMFGNHEDDVGMGELTKRVQEFAGTWLNTNMPTFRPELPTHQILEVTSPGGRTIRVGLLGLLAHQKNLYRPGAFGGHAIEPANETALRWAKVLHTEGCACVIPITHQDVADDLELARSQREPQFPVVVAGHEHEVIIEDVDGCLVIKAGAEAANAVVIDLVWPVEAPTGGFDLPTVTYKLQEVREFPEDEGMRTRVDRHMSSVRRLDGATLMRTTPTTPLSSVGIKTAQTSMGTVLCSHIRDALGADGCLLHGGGVRGEQDYEERFTYADLKAALPYANETVVVSMPGSVVRDAVAMSRARVGSNAYLQVDDGMTVEAPGDVVTTIGGLPLDPNREYRIATVLGLLGGMNAITPFVDYAKARPDLIPPRDAGREIKMILVDAFSMELWRQLGSFEDIDANQDGVVTPEELERAISRATREAPSDIVVNDVFRMVDADGDGTITREEAEALVANHATTPPSPEDKQ